MRDWMRSGFGCGCSLLLPAVVVLLAAGGCKKGAASSSTSSAAGGGNGATKVTLTLDWNPEPEFGGFYAAQAAGAFGRHGLDVEIKPMGQGETWKLVDQGKTDFATTAADQVLIARANGADVVALFAVYQTFPQGVMVHKALGFTKLEDVFTHDGSLEAEDATWLKYLRKKFGDRKVKLVANSPGIGVFLAKPDWSKQCFVTSEPILAARAGSDPQTFLIADAGYNPYTTVVIARGDTVRNKPELVRSMVAACRDGWRAYLDDPAPANAVMGKINRDMDAQTFTEAAAAQKPLIETEETKKNGLGTMTKERWQALAQQLVDLGVLKTAPPVEECFASPDRIASK
jgi:NitT/TauT family transport system substrate-binding protein